MTAGAQNRPPAEEPSGRKGPITAQTHPNNPELWNVEAMMEDAVIQISRRYNLNKAQEDYTRLLLTSRVKAFLEEYESDVRELLKESIDLRRGLIAGTAETYKRWATRAEPIYKAAQEAILAGNQEWGEILNDDQKKIHDADLALMKSQFTQVTKIMEDWKSGRGVPVSPAAASGTLRSGEMAKVSEAQPGIVRQVMEDNWLAYVNLFIQTFGLDEKQAVAAREKIHKEVREDAKKYREKRKADFAELEEQARLPKPKWQPTELARRRGELDRPLQELFIALDRRLQQLPTSKQRAEVDPERRRQLEQMYRSLAGELRDAAGQSQTGKTQVRTVGPSPVTGGTTSRPAEQPPAKPSEEQPERLEDNPEVPPT